jgi:hypothetical protein
MNLESVQSQLLIPSHVERNILVGERLQGGFWHETLARPKNPPREATNQESERSLLGLSVIERDGHHFGLPFLLDRVPMEAYAEGSGGASNSSEVETSRMRSIRSCRRSKTYSNGAGGDGRNPVR